MNHAETQYQQYQERAERIQLLEGGSREFADTAEKVGNRCILVIKESGLPADMASRKDVLKSRLAVPELYEILTVKQFREKYLHP